MDASQQEVFEKTAKSLLPGVLDGYNSTVFAYGVSYWKSIHHLDMLTLVSGNRVREDAYHLW